MPASVAAPGPLQPRPPTCSSGPVRTPDVREGRTVRVSRPGVRPGSRTIALPWNSVERRGTLSPTETRLDRLGDVHHSAGDARAARWAWTQALRTLDELGHPDSDRVRAKVRVPGNRLPAVI